MRLNNASGHWVIKEGKHVGFKKKKPSPEGPADTSPLLNQLGAGGRVRADTMVDTGGLTGWGCLLKGEGSEGTGHMTSMFGLPS